MRRQSWKRWTQSRAALLNVSMTERVPADLRDAITNLTSVALASEQLEELGELLVLQLSEDLIGEPDQS